MSDHSNGSRLVVWRFPFLEDGCVMGVRLQIPRVLGQYAGGRLELEIPGHSVAEVLAHLEQAYPALYPNLCDECGRVRRHIHLFVNDQLVVGAQNLDHPVAPGDVLAVFQAVSGG